MEDIQKGDFVTIIAHGKHQGKRGEVVDVKPRTSMLPPHAIVRVGGGLHPFQLHGLSVVQPNVGASSSTNSELANYRKQYGGLTLEEKDGTIITEMLDRWNRFLKKD